MFSFYFVSKTFEKSQGKNNIKVQFPIQEETTRNLSVALFKINYVGTCSKNNLSKKRANTLQNSLTCIIFIGEFENHKSEYLLSVGTRVPI